VAEEGYNWSFFTPAEMWFGFLQGALNTLPKQDKLSTCGDKAGDTRKYVLDAINNLNARNFEKFVADSSLAMSLASNLFYFCYFGGKETFTYDYLANLFSNEFNVLNNMYFNAGYIWTDFILLNVATPSTTEDDYMYFMSFYAGDFLFRFIFRATMNG